MNINEVVDEYQCPGCMHGTNSTNCEEFETDPNLKCCKNHIPGTFKVQGGTIMLGMPTGFNKCGIFSKVKNREDIAHLQVFEPDDVLWYDWLNVPVWMHLDYKGNTLVRGIQPRINEPFLHIIIGDRRNEIRNNSDFNCIELTDAQIESMD